MIFEQKHGLTVNYFTAFPFQDASYGEHIQSCYELITVRSGSMVVFIDRVPYTVPEGSAILVFPYKIHSFTTPKNSSGSICIFNSEVLPDLETCCKDKIPQNPVFRLTKSYLAEEICQCSDMTSLFVLRSVLYMCIHELFSQTELIDPQESGTVFQRLLKEIFIYVNTHYKETCSLRKISEHLKYDYYYISRHFSQYTGMSFHEYVSRVRVTKACHLLRTSQTTVADVSVACGFSSLRSFNRNFIRFTNLTPTDYRTQFKGISLAEDVVLPN